MTHASPIWRPAAPESSQTTLFRNHVNATYSLSLSTYQDLYQWSITHRSDFWTAVWEYENVIGDKPAEPAVDETATPADNPHWFAGAKLNWAENQLRHAQLHPGDIAIIQTSEPCSVWSPEPKRVTQRELLELVGSVQRSLVKAGVGRGDRVAWYGGNCLEAVVVLLATSSVGGVFSSAAADFGVDGVVERLEQIRPKVLFVTNAVVYAGTPRPLLPLLPKLLSALSSAPTHTVVVPHLPLSLAPLPDKLETAVLWDDFRDTTSTAPPRFERISFNEPIWILFSSGTTGKPKAIVHRAGGMLIDSLREHHIAGDISRGDVYFYYTTPGWMMFQYLVSGLATGATILLYEGSPLKDPSVLWRLADDLGITVFGTSAKYIEQISKTYPNVGQRHSLASVRQILSTGSPLSPGLFDYVYEHVKKDVLLGSITGGSDICSVFAGRCTALPVFRGEIQARMLGFALDVEATEPGLPGELICRKAFPIEPLGFWPLPGYGFDEGDVQAAQQRFLDSYFKDDKGTWYHGDYVRVTPSQLDNSGGVIMLGRSDGVLNPGGIRFGPTDIYSVLDTDEFHALGLEETLVVGLMVEGGADEKVVLFVKLREGTEWNDALVKRVKTEIRLKRSARHVPGRIERVSDVPVTLTGKRVEGPIVDVLLIAAARIGHSCPVPPKHTLMAVPIRKLINGAHVESINPATLRNPECLAEYVKLGAKMRQEENV